MPYEMSAVTEEKCWELLEEVKDPEMPVVSMVEMGMIHQVKVSDDMVTVEVLPTFVGCPALDMMKNDISNKLKGLAGVKEINVSFVYQPPWTSDRISNEGREKLKTLGIVTPPPQQDDTWQVACPYCDSPYTHVENLFGPAACRSILYCRHCKNPFEALKPIYE
ncbi:1,2-phenylacetyl-CoA epoxidase subunit PaaD [Brevibacillus daliensis]|uniref:1,2-phenylacetyl-CoA epoxidase subunit PaaD n=1 Tax=Brevibacillus daliensis TaxID=2892995 RepID=UPI001E5DBC06|nr:1,2-phenylacetyl-CoA epoxidase subunit PaaD [Brevibacillus daliensis]